MTCKCIAEYKELQREKSDKGTDTPSPLLNVYNGVPLHVLSIPSNALKVLALICSLLLCFLTLHGILVLHLFQRATESGTCWVGLDSGGSNKQVSSEFKSSVLSPQDDCCSFVVLQWMFSRELHYIWVSFHLLR